MKRNSTAFLIPSPWDGDEHKPIPRSYRVWFRLYKWCEQMRHWVGLHAYSSAGWAYRCTWCGKVRRR